MVAFSLQIVLLMAAAYFLGAALACVIRRALSPAARVVAPAERRVEPLPEVAQGPGFGREPGPAARPASTPAQRPVPASGPAVAPVAGPVVTSAGGPQDLKSIQRIDAVTETRLNGLGVTRYEQIAAWKRADVDRIGQTLGDRKRIARENWIEQAQVLAKGGQTLFSVRRARGEGSTAAPTPDEGVPGSPPLPPIAPPLPLPMSRVGVSAVVIAPPAEAPRTAAPAAPGGAPLVSDRAAFAREPGAAVPIRPAQPATHDNLQRIGGVTAETERRLNALGVARYSEIAQWSPAAVERVDRELGLAGRISRENWIEQAQILSRGGDTRFSLEFDRRGHAPGAPPPKPIKLPDAIREHEAARASQDAGQAEGVPLRADLGSLRSVRSQAYQDTSEPGPEAARRAAARKVARPGAADDLKRIRGIGVLIERKLNSLGVGSYEDIANWTREDIDRVSQSLDFKGRIERENWVEQARILAAGGDTEFSRKLDRGDGGRKS
jgi:predicted flap endonuclease-1-like 5' DNA nuclease